MYSRQGDPDSHRLVSVTEMTQADRVQKPTCSQRVSPLDNGMHLWLPSASAYVEDPCRAPLVTFIMCRRLERSASRMLRCARATCATLALACPPLLTRNKCSVAVPFVSSFIFSPGTLDFCSKGSCCFIFHIHTFNSRSLDLIMEALSSDGFVAHQLRHGRTPSGNTSTNQRVAIAADKEERRRRKEEKKNEKMIKRALKAARSAAAAAAQKDELDSSVIDPALVDLPSNSAESSESSARKRKAASKSPLAKVSVDQFGRPTNEFARASKKKKGESSASATTTGAGGLDLDALRVQFRAPGAMEAFLSEKWLSTVQLRELEEQGCELD